VERTNVTAQKRLYDARDMKELQKLAFEIASVSSFDEDFPPEELLIQNHNPLAKGWQSER
jgi:hypothetical protein